MTFAFLASRTVCQTKSAEILKRFKFWLYGVTNLKNDYQRIGQFQISILLSCSSNSNHPKNIFNCVQILTNWCKNGTFTYKARAPKTVAYFSMMMCVEFQQRVNCFNELRLAFIHKGNNKASEIWHFVKSWRANFRKISEVLRKALILRIRTVSM